VFARKGIGRIGHVTPKAMENERRFVASLREAGEHPNIVQIINHGTLGKWSESNIDFIDMELCDVTLTNYVDYVHNRTPIDPPSAPVDTLFTLHRTDAAFVRKDCGPLEKVQNLWTIGVHIASGLEFLHARSHIHRDVKPGNGMSTICHAD
jgi:serine/threonine protein kinase